MLRNHEELIERENRGVRVLEPQIEEIRNRVRSISQISPELDQTESESTLLVFIFSSSSSRRPPLEALMEYEL